MRNIIITIEYDGTKYSGLANARSKVKLPSILSKLETVLEKQLEEHTVLVPAVKTEAGVHAKAQVLHFTTNNRMDPEEIKKRLNQYLPKDIRVIGAKEGDARFHADFNKKKAEFEYCINMAPYKDVFMDPYEFYAGKRLDAERLSKAAKVLEGTKDFVAFCGNAKMKKSTVRTISHIDVVTEGEKLKVVIQVDDIWPDFLLHAAGTMIEAAMGTITIDEIHEKVNHCERGSLCGYKAPAKGLTLQKIYY